MSASGGNQPAPKEKARGNWWTIPAITAAVLAAFFAVGYIIYVPPHREYLANRNFRALAVLGNQVQRAISIHGSVLEFAADLAEPARNPKNRHKEDLNQFLVLRPEDRSLNPEDRARETRKDYLKYLAPQFELLEVPIAKKDDGRSEPRLQVKRRNGEWELILTADRHPSSHRDYLGRLDLATILQPLISTLPFDDLLLISERGTVVYEMNKSGPQFTTLASLLEARTTGDGKAESTPEKKPDESDDASKVSQNTEDPWKSRSTNLTEVKVANVRYKLFLQPVLVDVFSDEPGKTEAPREWILAGLKSSQSLEWEALAVSSDVVIWATAVFLIIFMSGPVLKIFLMNHRERLRFAEIGLLALSLILLTGVITIAALQTFGFPLNNETDWRLQQLGEKLSKNVHDELRDMRDQLVSWCRSPQLRADFISAATTHWEMIRKAPASLNENTSPRVGATPDATIYPFLGNAFWTDDDGLQVVKWSASGFLTPLIDVSHQPLFEHAKTVYLDGKGPPFYFGSVVPPNRSEYLAVLTIRTQDCNSSLGTEGLREDLATGTAALSAQPLSLMDPILPYGYGFALIDEKGRVVFHSNKTRNLHENFLEETDWNRELQAAAFGHSSLGAVSVRYMGKDFRARAFPVPGLSQAPWSLVVYRDLTPVRTINLEAVAITASLFAAILGPPVLLIAIWCGTRRLRFAPEWLWPNQARTPTYISVIIIHCVLIVVFLMAGFSGPIEQNFLSCFLLPYASLVLTIWCFRAQQRGGVRIQRSPGIELGVAATPALLAIIAPLLYFACARMRMHAISNWSVLIGFAFVGAMPLLERPGRYMIVQKIRSFYRWKSHAVPADQPDEHRQPWRRFYLLSVLLPLTVIGVLTPTALFRASLSVEQRLGLKQAQLHLAAALNGRLLRIEAGCHSGELSEAGCKALRDKGSTAWTRMVHDPLFSRDGKLPAAPHSDVVPKPDLYSPWLQMLIGNLHHQFNDASSEMAGMISDRRVRTGSAEPDWYWIDRSTKDGRQMALRWHGVHFIASENEDQENDLEITAFAPAFSFANLVVGIFVAGIVILLMSTIVWAITRKIFLFQIFPLRISGEREAVEAARDGRNVVLLLPSCCQWRFPGTKYTFSIPERMTAPNWVEQIDFASLPVQTLIELDHFEHTTGIAEIDSQKAVLIEHLSARTNLQFAVLMTVPVSTKNYRDMFPNLEVIDLRDELAYWLKQYEGPARDAIWRECYPMPALWPIGAQFARDLEHSESHSAETVASEMLERAEPYYKLIWKECSDDQKFVLAQLAEDGMVNPANVRAIRQLVRRGLILTTPQFRLVNESFRRFLRSVVTAELKKHWKRQSRQSGWGRMHGAFALTMAFLGVFLLATQNALWQSSAAYVTALIGVLGTAGKLLNVFKTGSSPAEKSE